MGASPLRERAVVVLGWRRELEIARILARKGDCAKSSSRDPDLLQGFEVRLGCGCEKIVAAHAYLFCPRLPGFCLTKSAYLISGSYNQNVITGSATVWNGPHVCNFGRLLILLGVADIRAISS